MSSNNRATILLAQAALMFGVGCSSDPEPVAPAEDASVTERDAGTRDTGPDSPADAGESDVGTEVDAGETDAGMSNFPTLPDYRTCRANSDCPVGLGECVKSVALNRPDFNGATTATLSAVLQGLRPNEGVCSRPCTLDETECEALTLTNAAGEPVAFTCQVVTTGAISYPVPAPAFPYANQIDFGEQARGRSFAAICRPPFGLDEIHSEDFCVACDVSTPCNGVCYRFDTEAVVTSTGAPGVCLSRAPTALCPLGFAARDVDGQGEVCVPEIETCGACQDRDADGHGAGHCAEVEVDCDDTNRNAYYSVADPEHPFPTFCGRFDFNCNGESDTSEQVGVDTYLEYHCEYCGDDAHDRTVQAGTPAEALLECVAGTVRTSTCAGAQRAHCSGDVRIVGCETDAVGGQFFFRDADGDMFGDPNLPQLGCPSGNPPSGFVADNTDCNDGDPLINPAAMDVCECWGDCEQPNARVDNDCNGAFDDDVTNYAWGIDIDGDGATQSAVPAAMYCGAPFMNAVITGGAEDCDDTRTNVYGAHTRITDAAGAPLALPIIAAPPRDAAGELYTVTVGGVAEVCDGLDNDCANGTDDGVLTTYYRDMDGDMFGNLSVNVTACAAPAGYIAVSAGTPFDCNDGVPTIYPNAPEVCNGVDESCGNDGDAPVPAGGWSGVGVACSIPGALGDCSAGSRVNSCVGGALVCGSPLYAAKLWDDPAPGPRRGGDANCDGSSLFSRPRIHVDQSGGNDNSNTGGLGDPVRTVARALVLAQPNGQVYLRAGTHSAAATVALPGNVDIVGGWTFNTVNVWTYNAAGRSIIDRGTVGSDVVAVSAFNVGPTTLSQLDIRLIGAAATGASFQGIQNTNSVIRLHDVTIVMPRGGNGFTGTDAANGLDGVNGGVPGIPGASHVGGARFCPPFDTNISGGAGSNPPGNGLPGAGPNPGLWLGNPGADGSGGIGGRRASAPRGIGVMSGNQGALENVPPLGGASGVHGSGGAGHRGVTGLSAGGGGGSGGCAGPAAGRGGHGGSSFGLFSVNGTFQFIEPTTISITMNGAGNGGNGGRGGSGGARGFGSTPFCCGAGIGGNGGRGGAGGGGVGGNGGVSYPYFHRGFGNACASFPVSIVAPTGPGGVAGTGGLQGGGANGHPNGGGQTGFAGDAARCFWARACSQGCGTGEYCVSGWCYR